MLAVLSNPDLKKRREYAKFHREAFGEPDEDPDIELRLLIAEPNCDKAVERFGNRPGFRDRLIDLLIEELSVPGTPVQDAELHRAFVASALGDLGDVRTVRPLLELLLNYFKQDGSLSACPGTIARALEKVVAVHGRALGAEQLLAIVALPDSVDTFDSFWKRFRLVYFTELKRIAREEMVRRQNQP